MNGMIKSKTMIERVIATEKSRNKMSSRDGEREREPQCSLRLSPHPYYSDEKINETRRFSFRTLLIKSNILVVIFLPQERTNQLVNEEALVMTESAKPLPLPWTAKEARYQVLHM